MRHVRRIATWQCPACRRAISVERRHQFSWGGPNGARLYGRLVLRSDSPLPAAKRRNHEWTLLSISRRKTGRRLSQAICLTAFWQLWPCSKSLAGLEWADGIRRKGQRMIPTYRQKITKNTREGINDCTDWMAFEPSGHWRTRPTDAGWPGLVD